MEYIQYFYILNGSKINFPPNLIVWLNKLYI